MWEGLRTAHTPTGVGLRHHLHEVVEPRSAQRRQGHAEEADHAEPPGPLLYGHAAPSAWHCDWSTVVPAAPFEGHFRILW